MYGGYVAAIIAIVICLAIILLNRKHPFDPSIGETKPTWKDKALYPKEYVHGLGGFAAMIAMLLVGVPVLIAFVILVLAVYGYEWSQRFINRIDMVAGLIGGIIALAIYMVHGHAFHQSLYRWW